MRPKRLTGFVIVVAEETISSAEMTMVVEAKMEVGQLSVQFCLANVS